MRTLAIDHGVKRIGLAISDETGTIATPVGYVGNLAEVLQVATDRGVGRLLVGLPRKLDGTASPQTERVQGFITALRQATTLPVLTWDERLTTAQAERVLLEGNTRRQQRKEVRDQLAATILLQSFLDSEGGASAPPQS